MHKAREMAMLVAELQRMRQEDHTEEVCFFFIFRQNYLMKKF